jgi:hypothetical protein
MPAFKGSTSFQCSLRTAKLVSPLIEIVGGPIPEFVMTIRRQVVRERQSDLIRPFGHFSGYFGLQVEVPLWRRYRRLASAEWKAVFPSKR